MKEKDGKSLRSALKAYFHDKLIDQYEWFLRLDDDTVLQWENLNLFLVGNKRRARD